MNNRPRPRLRAVAIASTAASAGLAVLLAFTWIRMWRLATTVDDLERDLTRIERNRDARAADAAAPVSPALLQYELELAGRGEVFPAMAATDAPEYGPLADLRVTNTANRPFAQTVSAEVPGWSLRTEQTVVVRPGETRRIRIQPELLPRAYDNDETSRAALEVRSVGSDGALLFAESRPVLVHGGGEIYWGRRFANAQVTARWVTPHDPTVLELVSHARHYVSQGRMAGYNTTSGSIEAQVRAQAAAVYRALQRSGLSEVSGQFLAGERVDQPQRIRLPPETLRLASASCMDVSIVFASAMENLGMQPLVVIVPGHALAGVRLGRNDRDVLYLDLTALPGGSFEAAVARARRWLDQTAPADVLEVDVAAARTAGFYPLAERTANRASFDTATQAAQPASRSEN